MVVMKGEAITAGSKPTRLASRGREQPTSLAHSTVPTRVAQTTRATWGVTVGFCSSQRSTSIIFTKLAAARHSPQQTETQNSFHST